MDWTDTQQDSTGTATDHYVKTGDPLNNNQALHEEYDLTETSDYVNKSMREPWAFHPQGPYERF